VTRCRNCGNAAHKTQHCPRFGPWYPEPGKTSADYADIRDMIATKVAADILAEHEGHSYDGDEDLGMATLNPSVGITDPMERMAQTYACGTCGAESGYACLSSSGRTSKKSHKSRYKQIPVNF
jgi:hypothetical protein